MDSQNVLVVDDEPDIRELLALTLNKMDLKTHCAQDLGEAHQLLAKHAFALCLTDMRLPDGNGIELVRHIQQSHPKLPIAVITAHGNVDAAVESLKAGAFDFVAKPIDLSRLRELIRAALKLNSPSRSSQDSRLHLIGQSPAMDETRKTMEKLSRSQAPVYISGESGTGKELVARLIHQAGPRGEAPFVPVNCGAIPSELMESEFFGHRKGAFTGAVADKQGLFQAADGGTLFLDEVSELPLHMQVKLLRAIQEKAVRRVGDQKETSVNARILSATHQDLADLVRDGGFRQDLFYRINVIELRVPALRERKEDIPLLADHILHKLNHQHPGEAPKLGDKALSALSDYPFPGNVRELENVLERALTLYEGKQIDPADLRLPNIDEEPEVNDDTPPEDLPRYLDDLERKAINRALEITRFNKTAAAKRLGITFRALRYRLKKLDMDD